MGRTALAIGLLADPQYASTIADRTSPDQDGGEDRVQRFRSAKDSTRQALARMSTCAAVVQLGDIIQSDDAQSTAEIKADLDTMCRVFDAFEAPVLHTLGNHCIGRLDRGTVCEKLGIPKPRWMRLLPSFARRALSSSCPSSYYARKISESWTIIVLDTTELSGHGGFEPSSRQARESATYLSNHPVDKEPHMIPWNGGCTQRQLDWLKDQLQKAVKRGTLVILASHHPIHPEAARRTHLAWNYAEILAIASACPAVRLVISGHDHVGGASRQSCRGGIRQIYMTLPAILEADVDSTEYLVLNLDELERRTDQRSAETPRHDNGNLVLAGGGKATRLFSRVAP